MLGIVDATAHLYLWMVVLVLNIGVTMLMSHRHLLPHVVILLVCNLVKHILLLNVLELLLEHELVS